jgi:hypothetical protein
VTPEQYFSTYVEPAFRDYKAAERDLTTAVINRADTAPAEAVVMQKAMAAATPAWHLADWMWKQFHATDPARLLGAASLGDYRVRLQNAALWQCKYGF